MIYRHLNMDTISARFKQKVKIEWSHPFAYAIGLITSDGCLSSDYRHILFASKDQELIEKFKGALRLGNKIGKNRRGGEVEKKYFHIQFGDKIFYQFLNSIGLYRAKSRTIQSVLVPLIYFPAFLRGLFDGDGCFYSFWDKRWPASFGFQVSFPSASLLFVMWLKDHLSKLYGVKGFIRKGDGVFNLQYVKGDSRKICSIMYSNAGELYLSRKYKKIM